MWPFDTLRRLRNCDRYDHDFYRVDGGEERLEVRTLCATIETDGRLERYRRGPKTYKVFVEQSNRVLECRFCGEVNERWKDESAAVVGTPINAEHLNAAKNKLKSHINEADDPKRCTTVKIQ